MGIPPAAIGVPPLEVQVAPPSAVPPLEPIPIIPGAPVGAEMQGILSVEAQKMAGLLQAGSTADLQTAASVLKKDILSLKIPGDTPTAFANQITLINETNRLAANTGARITQEPPPDGQGWPKHVQLFIEKGNERIATGAIVDVPPPPMFPEIPPKPGELK